MQQAVLVVVTFGMHVASLDKAEAVEWERLLRDDQVTLSDRFTGIVERQSRFVFRIAYAILRNIEDAEDAVQETFLKLYRTGAWRQVRDERAFLARAAWRIAVEKLPRARNLARAAEMISQAGSPESMAMSGDQAGVVHQLMDSLPEELRQPLALSAIEELNSREIAAVMAIPEGTVRRRIMRARQILREKFERFGEVRYEK